MEKRNITTFEEAAAYLYSAPRFTSKNSLEDTRCFLHKLGDPDRQMRILHVAGTNGKGSVCAYLCSILEEAGYSTVMFTSPHLVDIRERFVIKGRMVSKEAFLSAFLQVYDGLDWESLGKGKGYHPTFFEYLFFMAMLLFAGEEPDYCILETGLGGRLDATNAVAHKDLTIITCIGLDHMEYLGSTIAQIAGEKAGILRAGVPLVYADVEEDASKIIRQYSEELDIKAYPVSKGDYRFLNFHNLNIDFSLHTEYYGYISLTLQTIAQYQMENVSLAVRAIEVLDQGRTITAEQMIRGVAKCVWPGRMEQILPGVYVDGAHNADGIRAFLDTVGQDGYEGRRTLLFSAVRDKDCGSMVEQVAASGLFGRIVFARMRTDRTAQPRYLAELLAKYQIPYEQYDSVDAAFKELLKGQEGRRIYIAGSLYLVGEIKESLLHD